jgi:glutathionyl-hydroquinone reductase
MRYRNNDEFVNDGTQTERRWCLRKGIIAYPVVIHKTYKARSGRIKNYVKINVDCQGKLLQGTSIYKQEIELTEALQKIYAHYYARRFGNEIMK